MTARQREMVDTVAAGLRVLRPEVDISDERIEERARNIVAALMSIEWIEVAANKRDTAPMCRRCGGNAETCGHAEILLHTAVSLDTRLKIARGLMDTINARHPRDDQQPESDQQRQEENRK